MQNNILNYYNDPIYGKIEVNNIANIIINDSIFERLKYIKQLATCYLVYPNTNHSRFEHSIGTYHLVRLFLENLIKNSSPKELLYLKNIKYLKNYNLDIDIDKIIELIKIAGLCHDLGHGPFSHCFDDYFLNNYIDNNFKHHEYRSCYLLNEIIKKYDELKNYF